MPEVMDLDNGSESDFYGKYWSQHSKGHNGYEGVVSARQLDETVGQFLARLPPATTRVTFNCPWIYIWNPFVPSDRKAPGQADGDAVGGGEMTGEFIIRAQKRFDQYKDFVEKNRTKTGRISAKIKEEGKEFTGDVLKLAGQLGVTEGKASGHWIIWPAPEHCNDVWAKVARATANGELGIAAKISPREEPDRQRLVCVYTRDFNDKDDVARVLNQLKELGLVREEQKKQICYKTDAFTYLGVNSDSKKIGLEVGKYQSNEIFAYLNRAQVEQFEAAVCLRPKQ
ncbi:hypothetical protein INS49_009152 [Diaporthe citri]|uniref:uncharacterized protein n=1 Tax=Diaporthe citri TaxID=83186 RepID=UPI001C81269A|nr:uncharacterized protein INS49_009152 [Diaporthe citri]KAG6364049.1 hypothetical protein INS49_009152 [Diaporthe citri]